MFCPAAKQGYLPQTSGFFQMLCRRMDILAAQVQYAGLPSPAATALANAVDGCSLLPASTLDGSIVFEAALSP